jgi:hypothetical protein
MEQLVNCLTESRRVATQYQTHAAQNTTMLAPSMLAFWL